MQGGLASQYGGRPRLAGVDAARPSSGSRAGWTLSRSLAVGIHRESAAVGGWWCAHVIVLRPEKIGSISVSCTSRNFLYEGHVEGFQSDWIRFLPFEELLFR